MMEGYMCISWFFYHFRMQKKMMKTGEKILVKMLLDKEWRN